MCAQVWIITQANVCLQTLFLVKKWAPSRKLSNKKTTTGNGEKEEVALRLGGTDK